MSALKLMRSHVFEAVAFSGGVFIFWISMPHLFVWWIQRTLPIASGLPFRKIAAPVMLFVDILTSAGAILCLSRIVTFLVLGRWVKLEDQ